MAGAHLAVQRRRRGRGGGVLEGGRRAVRAHPQGGRGQPRAHRQGGHCDGQGDGAAQAHGPRRAGRGPVPAKGAQPAAAHLPPGSAAGASKRPSSPSPPVQPRPTWCCVNSPTLLGVLRRAFVESNCTVAARNTLLVAAWCGRVAAGREHRGPRAGSRGPGRAGGRDQRGVAQALRGADHRPAHPHRGRPLPLPGAAADPALCAPRGGSAGSLSESRAACTHTPPPRSAGDAYPMLPAGRGQRRLRDAGDPKP